MKKKVLAVLLTVAMSTGLLAGCGSSSSSGSAASTSEASSTAVSGGSSSGDTVVIGTQEMPNDEGIAKALDYFKEETGMNVEIKQFDSGKDVNTALASKSIDFGLFGSCPASLAIAQGIDVKFIWIHEVLGPVESLVARSDEGITDVAGLKGKTIATPFASTAHFSLLHALENAGLSESDVNLLDMQPSEIYAAWQNKQIDATYVWEPTLSSLTDATTIVTSADMAKAGYMTSNVELVRGDYAKEHPDVVTAYIKAVSKAVDLFQTNKEEAVSTIAKFMELDEADAESQMSGSTWLSAKDQLGSDYLGTSNSKGAVVQNLYDTATFLKDQGSITELPDKSVFEDAVDPEYIEKSLE